MKPRARHKPGTPKQRRTTKPSITIRNATTKDIEGVYETFLEMAAAEDSACRRIGRYMVNTRQRRKDFTAQAKATLAREFKKEGSIYLVAEFDGALVGYAFATLKNLNDPFFKPVRVGTLDAIAVKKKYRGRGIARELHQELVRWFSMNRCQSIQLDVLSKNPAVDLYKKWGYTVTAHRMTKALRT